MVISWLLVNLIPDHATRHRHFILFNIRKTFHLFLDYMGNFQHYQYSVLPSMSCFLQPTLHLHYWQAPSSYTSPLSSSGWCIPPEYIRRANKGEIMNITQSIPGGERSTIFLQNTWTRTWGSINYLICVMIHAEVIQIIEQLDKLLVQQFVHALNYHQPPPAHSEQVNNSLFMFRKNTQNKPIMACRRSDNCMFIIQNYWHLLKHYCRGNHIFKSKIHFKFIFL